MADLDIVIPVYNEGPGIARVLDALSRSVRTPCRVLICYDSDDDDTLPALASYRATRFEIVGVKNESRGPLGATLAGFAASNADAVLVLPADDDYNAGRIDDMVALLRAGNDVVCANRFAQASRVSGYPWLKTILVRTAALLLHCFARLPARDPTNGFRLFSRRVIKGIPVETKEGFAYSMELMVKCHRLGWRIGEVPADWFERTTGESRFRIGRWWPTYWRWFRYAFETAYLRAPPESVRLR